MSLTVFFAVCILSIDFMIYFFFKLVYGEKRDGKRRRLPPGYYTDDFPSNRRTLPSALHSDPAPKNKPDGPKRVLTMPQKLESPATNGQLRHI